MLVVQWFDKKPEIRRVTRKLGCMTPGLLGPADADHMDVQAKWLAIDLMFFYYKND